MEMLRSRTFSAQINLGLKLLSKTDPNISASGQFVIHTKNASLFRSHGNSPVELYC